MVEKLSALSMGRAFLIGLVIAAFYYFIAYDDGQMYLNQISSLQSQITTTRQEIQAVDRKLERARQYKETAEALGEQFKRLTSYIPEQMSPSDLMRTISTEAKAAGTNIVRISDATSGTRGEFYEEMSVDIELMGTYSQLLLFLSYLTKLDRILTVGKMTVRVAQNSAGAESPQLTFSAQIRGYKYSGVGVTN